jgi:hypothetical protein
MAAVGGAGLLSISRCTWQLAAAGRVSEKRALGLASLTATPKSSYTVDLEPLSQAASRSDTGSPHFTPLSRCALCRQASKVRTVCVSCASTGLCGGQRATAVPTATHYSDCLAEARARHSMAQACAVNCNCLPDVSRVDGGPVVRLAPLCASDREVQPMCKELQCIPFLRLTDMSTRQRLTWFANEA